MRTVIIALALSAVTVATMLPEPVHADAVADAPVPALDPRLTPIAFAVGVWSCKGHYSTVPPFTVEHDVVAIARFAPDVGGQWIVASYQELTTPANPAPIAIKDAITFDRFTGAGVRALYDSNTGTLRESFTQTGGRLEFGGGDYLLAGAAAPFTETVIYDDARESFTTDSRVFGVTFQTQTCNRLH